MQFLMLVMGLMQAPIPPDQDFLLSATPPWYYNSSQRIPPTYTCPLTNQILENRGPLSRQEVWIAKLQGY